MTQRPAEHYVDRMDQAANDNIHDVLENRAPLTEHTLAEAARVLNYGGSTDDATALATFAEARAQHPAYQIEYRYAAIQVFRLRVQELLGVERDL